MGKSTIALAALTLFGACSPETKQEVSETKEPEKKISLLGEARKGWVVNSDTLMGRKGAISQWNAHKVLPISYESNFKHGTDIGGVWCGIEGRTEAYLEEGSSSVIMRVFNYNPFEIWGKNPERLPAGHSLVEVEVWNKKPTAQEIARVLNAYEVYVRKYGDGLKLGLDNKEMGVLRSEIKSLSGGVK